MRALCDTCDIVAELFQLPGRTDLNCSDCHAGICRVMELYQTLNEVERARCDASELKAELARAVEMLSRRVRFSARETSMKANLQYKC